MNLPEMILLQRIRRGDLKAFESLFRNYYAKLCGYAFRYIKDMDQAEEIVQDLFLKIWENRKKLAITSSIRSYLYRSVHNNCLLYLEHKAVEKKYENHIRYTTGQESGLDASERVNTDELEEIIDKTLNALPEKTRMIFNLSRFEGLKYREIAERMAVSIKTVEANMARALKLFRENLKDYVETD